MTLQWVATWTVESPYLTVLLILVILKGVKDVLIRMFGKAPVIQKPRLDAEEAIAWLQANRDLDSEEATREVVRQATQLERQQQRRQEEEPPVERRSAWDRLND